MEGVLANSSPLLADVWASSLCASSLCACRASPGNTRAWDGPPFFDRWTKIRASHFAAIVRQRLDTTLSPRTFLLLLVDTRHVTAVEVNRDPSDVGSASFFTWKRFTTSRRFEGGSIVLWEPGASFLPSAVAPSLFLFFLEKIWVAYSYPSSEHRAKLEE